MHILLAENLWMKAITSDKRWGKSHNTRPSAIHEMAATRVRRAMTTVISMSRVMLRYTTASLMGCGASGKRQKRMTTTTMRQENRNSQGLLGRSYFQA